jgi:hypothetical protein
VVYSLDSDVCAKFGDFPTCRPFVRRRGPIIRREEHSFTPPRSIYCFPGERALITFVPEGSGVKLLQHTTHHLLPIQHVDLFVTFVVGESSRSSTTIASVLSKKSGTTSSEPFGSACMAGNWQLPRCRSFVVAARLAPLAGVNVTPRRAVAMGSFEACKIVIHRIARGCCRPRFSL